jgi:hypothetical protein
MLPTTSAQSTAFRWIVGETNTVYAHPRFSNYCMGAGVDRTFNELLTVGFDISYDLANAFREQGRDETLSIGGTDHSYQLFHHVLCMNYHTEFALGDNGGTHGYIGTYIGLRDVFQKWRSSGAYSAYSSSSNGPAVRGSRILVPIGLRLGFRGPTDDGFMDLYFALGYQIGGGNHVMDEAMYRSVPEFMETSSLAITIGWAYGLGW